MITGLELLLAILPLLISATEHHKKGLRPAKIILSTKTKNEQQVLFYSEMFAELALLANILKAVLGDSLKRPDLEQLSPLSQADHEKIETALGSSAQPFGVLLERLLRSLNDLVSDKSLELTRSDVHIVCFHLPQD